MPLKRHQSLLDFSREHHEELLLGWKIKRGLKKGIEAERIATYCKHFFNNYLSKHMEKEEKYIFSKLDPSDPDIIKLLKEHRHVKELVEGLSRDKFNTAEYLTILAEELEKHIRFEERIFFERIQKELKEELLESMQPEEAQIKEGTEWEDCFW